MISKILLLRWVGKAMLDVGFSNLVAKTHDALVRILPHAEGFYKFPGPITYLDAY